MVVAVRRGRDKPVTTRRDGHSPPVDMAGAAIKGWWAQEATSGGFT